MEFGRTIWIPLIINGLISLLLITIVIIMILMITGLFLKKGSYGRFPYLLFFILTFWYIFFIITLSQFTLAILLENTSLEMIDKTLAYTFNRMLWGDIFPPDTDFRSIKNVIKIGFFMYLCVLEHLILNIKLLLIAIFQFPDWIHVISFPKQPDYCYLHFTCIPRVMIFFHRAWLAQPLTDEIRDNIVWVGVFLITSLFIIYPLLWAFIFRLYLKMRDRKK